MKAPSLDELGIKYGTDKSSLGHDYLRHYEIFLSPMRNDVVHILDIGLWEGASLKMWRDYFPNGKVFGFDIEDKSQYAEEGVYTMIGDQGNESDLLKAIEDYSIDIVNEDGSHEAEHQIFTFNTLFPHLNSGGLYILEDTLCSYDKSRWGKNANVFDRIHQMIDEVNVGGKINTGHISGNKPQQVKVLENLSYFEANIEWVFVGMGFVIVKKL